MKEKIKHLFEVNWNNLKTLKNKTLWLKGKLNVVLEVLIFSVSVNAAEGATGDVLQEKA